MGETGAWRFSGARARWGGACADVGRIAPGGGNIGRESRRMLRAWVAFVRFFCRRL
jgi:hypothetical protein